MRIINFFRAIHEYQILLAKSTLPTSKYQIVFQHALLRQNTYSRHYADILNLALMKSNLD